MTALVRLAGPAREPLLLDEIKAHLRIDHADEDGLLDGMRVAVRVAVEDFLRRALIEQRWQRVLDRWPDGPVSLPRPPLLAVTEIRIAQPDGQFAVIPPEIYRLENRAEPGFLLPRPGQRWPEPGIACAGIEIDYMAGYGSDWNAVPAPIRQAMLLLLASYYENRAESPPGIHGTVRSLLAPYRIISL